VKQFNFLRKKTFKEEIHRAGWNWVNACMVKRYHNDNADTSVWKLDGEIYGALQTAWAFNTKWSTNIYPSTVKVETTSVWSSVHPTFGMAVIADDVTVTNPQETKNGVDSSAISFDKNNPPFVLKLNSGWNFVSTDSSNNPPEKPSNPNPVNGANDVSVNPTLTWSATDVDGDPLTYDIYFGKSSTPPLVKSGAATKSYSPGTLATNTQYYWKVVAKDGKGGVTAGSVWSFKTTNSLSEIDAIMSNAKLIQKIELNCTVDLDKVVSFTSGTIQGNYAVWEEPLNNYKDNNDQASSPGSWGRWWQDLPDSVTLRYAIDSTGDFYVGVMGDNNSEVLSTLAVRHWSLGSYRDFSGNKVQNTEFIDMWTVNDIRTTFISWILGEWYKKLFNNNIVSNGPINYLQLLKKKFALKNNFSKPIYLISAFIYHAHKDYGSYDWWNSPIEDAKMAKWSPSDILDDGSRASKKIILVSATPLNNRPGDIRNQVLLFQDAKDSTLDLSNLQSFFAKKIEQYNEIFKNEKDKHKARLEIANIYLKNNATCLSVLTEEDYFLGNLIHISKIKDKVNLPILCKDFFIDTFQVPLAKSYGADAILIILAGVSDDLANNLYQEALKLDMSVIVEVHTVEEAQKALNFKDALIGINNRNLKTLKTDINTTYDIYNVVKNHKGPLISESGIKSKEELLELNSKTSINTFLIGESLLKKLDENSIFSVL
jgi:indole-3-glycerol phosphate synthase